MTATAPPTDASIDTDASVEMTSVEWNDETWSFPTDDGDWDFEAIEALESGHGIKFLRSLLGPRQMAKFTRGNRRTVGDAAELTSLIMAKYGEAKRS